MGSARPDASGSGGADVIVVGGGIAGVSAAAAVAETGRSVVLLEREAQLAHHTTGRSAAVYIVNYGGELASRLTLASRPFYDDPPEGLVDGPILEPRGLVMAGSAAHAAVIEQQIVEGQRLDPTIQRLDTAAIRSMVPVVRDEAAVVGMYEPGGSIMDVMGLHQAYVRQARSHDARIERHHEVVAIEPRANGWRVVTDRGSWDGEVVVNAAGAWGDVIGAMAGARPIGLEPRRRTAFTVTIDHDASGWPFVHLDTDDGPCYFKFEAGSQLLCSPSDEVPSPPVDAKAEELDVAMAIDRINRATTLGIRSVNTTWAGLRTFAPDRHPVIGWDDEVDGFCWMVGQGGTGITTSHASGRVVAALVDRRPMPDDLAAVGLELGALAPRR